MLGCCEHHLHGRAWTAACNTGYFVHNGCGTISLPGAESCTATRSRPQQQGPAVTDAVSMLGDGASHLNFHSAAHCCGLPPFKAMHYLTILKALSGHEPSQSNMIYMKIWGSALLLRRMPSDAADCIFNGHLWQNFRFFLKALPPNLPACVHRSSGAGLITLPCGGDPADQNLSSRQILGVGGRPPKRVPRRNPQQWEAGAAAGQAGNQGTSWDAWCRKTGLASRKQLWSWSSCLSLERLYA